MFREELDELARRLVVDLWAAKLRLVTAESCTGGLIAAVMTGVPGSSDVFEGGIVSYSNAMKMDLLGVSPASIVRVGAVSAEVASAMAAGALNAVQTADISVAVTGIAGPGGGTPEKPVGLVYLAAQRRGKRVTGREFRFGEIGRNEVRMATVYEALALVRQMM